MLEFFLGTKDQREAPKKIKDLEAEPHLTRNQERTLLALKKQARDLFKVRVRTTVLATCACLLAGVCTIHSTQNHDKLEGLPNWLTVEDVSKMGRERAMAAASAAIEWDSKFQCERNITIQRLENPDVEEIGGGLGLFTEELSDSGSITLADGVNPRDNVLHGMTHACTPDHPQSLRPHRVISDGLITGYKGLNVVGNLRTGPEMSWILFAEGMAERNASAFPGYSPSSSPCYQAVTSLTLQTFPLTNSEAHQYAKGNDGDSFVRARLKLLPNATVKGAEVEKVMREYQQACDNALKSISSSNPMSSFYFKLS